MELLIIGGTGFLGRHLVEYAVGRGHRVTLFNRGRSNPGLFPQVEEIHGNRDGELNLLADRRWNAVIDTCGYVPRVVRASAELLSSAVHHYTFISSISVYADFSTPGMDELAPVGTLADESVEEVTGETYGPLKVLCERVVQEVFPEGVLIIRPGLIVGPYDRTDRFTYWPHRIAQGSEVLAPGRPERSIEIIDVRDLAQWTIDLVEVGRTGVYNADGPERPLPLGELMETCAAVSGSGATVTWVDESFLLDRGVKPWSELPVWVPDTEEMAGFFSVDCSRAIADGLTFRPLVQTVRDTLEWDRTRPADHEWRAGLTRERERELLEEWHRRS